MQPAGLRAGQRRRAELDHVVDGRDVRQGIGRGGGNRGKRRGGRRAHNGGRRRGQRRGRPHEEGRWTGRGGERPHEKSRGNGKRRHMRTNAATRDHRRGNGRPATRRSARAAAAASAAPQPELPALGGAAALWPMAAWSRFRIRRSKRMAPRC